jgi:hypothetical protein
MSATPNLVGEIEDEARARMEIESAMDMRRRWERAAYGRR